MNEATDITIKLPGMDAIEGSEPIIIIGPNGSGKTRLGAQIARKNNGDFITALRDITLGNKLNMVPIEAANQAVLNNRDEISLHPYMYFSEFNLLMSKIIAHHSDASMRYRKSMQTTGSADSSPTKLEMIIELWGRLFPGRSLNLFSYSPTVTLNYLEAKPTFPAMRLSDGEKAVLYLATRVLDAQSNILVIDEPEVHLHNLLAVNFWDEMEALRSDCRFVYVTHDLSFALSRHPNFFIISRASSSPEIFTVNSMFPETLTRSLLAGASISFFAKRIFFCEGEYTSYDYNFFRAWFNDPDTAVFPVGSCRNVRECVSALNTATILNGVDVNGIIDLDYWPDDFLDNMPENIHILHLHEIENLFCIRDIFSIVAEMIGKSNEETEELYADFLEHAKKHFTGQAFVRHVSLRFKNRCEQQFHSALNDLSYHAPDESTKADYDEALSPTNWRTSPGDIFEEENSRLSLALSSDAIDLLKYFPGKELISSLSRKLGMTQSAYINFIIHNIKINEPRTIEVFNNLIPPRRTE